MIMTVLMAAVSKSRQKLIEKMPIGLRCSWMVHFRERNSRRSMGSTTKAGTAARVHSSLFDVLRPIADR